MSINYNNIQITSFNGGSSTTTSTASPATGTVAGDLLVMYVVITYGSGLTPTITPPSGWTVAVEDETNTSYTPTYMIAYKIATGSDDYTITYTSTTGRREFFVMRFSGDYNLANLITSGTKSSVSATSFTAPSVTSIADNSMLLSFCATKAGTVSADDLAVPPTGMTLLKSSNVADVGNQMAVAYQNAIPTGATGVKTWTAFVPSNQYGAGVNILINGLAITIDTINGDGSNPDIDVTASNTATTTGLGTITACTFTDSSGFVSTATPTMPSGDGSFVFAWPWADGSQQAKFGSVTASMTDGTLTATLPANLALPATYSSTTWSGATDLGEFYLGHYETLTNDNKVYYPTVVDGTSVTINPDGWMSFSSLPVTVPLLLHDCRSGGTGTITTKTLVVTESGVIEITSSNYRNPAIDKIQSGYNPFGYSPALPPYIDSVSGSVSQGSTMTIAAVNASSETSATLQFTDFESLTVGQPVVGNVPWLSGNSEVLQKNYLVSSDRPLTGTKVAKTHPVQENIGNLYYLTGGADELFVEFFARTITPDFTGTPDAAQIKFTRLCSGIAEHAVEPLMGITILGGATAATLQTGSGAGSTVSYGVNYTPDIWERHTLFMRLSDPSIPNGMKFYRTSMGNQWGSFFTTPNEWSEPESATRLSGAAATRQIETMFFPFFQREQQETIIDINHIYIHSNLERVYMSTSPTPTASTAFKHVVCPTLSRSLESIQFKSMIDVFDPEDDVYLYIVNANNKITPSGYLVRAGV